MASETKFRRASKQLERKMMELKAEVNDWCGFVKALNQCASTDRKLEDVIKTSKEIEKLYNEMMGATNVDDDIVTITCYGKKETRTRSDALAFYKDCMRACEGSERDRYCNIVMDLEDGKTECSDEVS